jgi:TATA-box binding protein (TBP) (component of TFIID and TFIIIB)
MSTSLKGVVAGATVITYDPSIMCRDDTFKYIVTLDAIRKKHNNLPTWVQITTITMTCKLLASERINLDLIREAFRKNGSIRIRRKGALYDGHEWTMKETTFYNQVTIGYRDQYSTKSIKVFPNGSFQVAGCSDLYDCKRVSKQLSFLLSSILNLSEPLTAEAFRVVMINTNFSMNRPVNLNTIIEQLSRERHIFEVSFNPDRYSAVKIKFKPGPDMKQVTASVFSTGKIIVTGAETLKEIAFAYDMLNTKLKNMVYDFQTFIDLAEKETTEFEELRDACIEAANYFLKDDDEIWAVEDGDLDTMHGIAQMIIKEIQKKRATSFDTVLGAKFGAWVDALTARGVSSWL